MYSDDHQIWIQPTPDEVISFDSDTGTTIRADTKAKALIKLANTLTDDPVQKVVEGMESGDGESDNDGFDSEEVYSV